MGTIEHDGTTLNFETRGAEEAPPVVMLHDAGSDLRMWLPAARGLEQDYWLVLPDLRGHGLSGCPAGTATAGIETYLDDVEAILEALGIELCAVVGAGFGGMIGLQLAMRHPERVAALVLCGPSPLDRAPRYAEHAAASTDLATDEDYVRRRGALAYGMRLAATVRDSYVANGMIGKFRKVETDGLLGALHAWRLASVVPGLPGLRTPVMLVTGADDPTATAMDGLAGQLPAPRRVVIRDAGADVPATHAIQFAAEVARFFTAIENGRPVGERVTV